MSRKSKKILFVSDLHGNQKHFRYAFNLAMERGVDYLIFGGDNAPKSQTKRCPIKQYRFFEKSLLPLIRDFQNSQKHTALKTEIIFVYGNDDFRSYRKKLKVLLSDLNVKLLWNGVHDIDDGYSIIGYSYVPITPFKYKDWEKIDVHDKERESGATHGYVSQREGLGEVGWDSIAARGTIEKDMERLFYGKHPKKSILVSHAPPADTKLDVINTGQHVGSIAIRRAIEKYKPLVSLHGHIHESYKKTGQYADRVVGGTISINPGHFFNENSLNAVLIHLSFFMKTERITYPTARNRWPT